MNRATITRWLTRQRLKFIYLDCSGGDRSTSQKFVEVMMVCYGQQGTAFTDSDLDYVSGNVKKENFV